MNEKEAWYKGDVLDCVRHGKGKYTYPFGGKKLFCYDGNWAKGTRQGQGEFKVNGHSSYVGEFNNGEINGKGTKVWDDGRTFEGEWLNGEMHGKGFWTHTRKDETYDGYFADNKRHGHGVLQKGLESYSGEFSYHKFHGAGRYLFSNQFVVEGTFRENLINGNATVDWHKLAYLKGEWVNGVPHGRGFFYALDSSYDFEGNWEGGLPLITATAASLWVAVDRSAADAESAIKAKDNKGKDKKKAPPPAAAKKGKGEAPVIEPTVTVPQGEALGSADIRCYLGKGPDEPMLEPVVVEIKKGAKTAAATPDVPTVPPPAMYSAPCERTRRVRIRLRPIIPEDPPVSVVPPGKGAVSTSDVPEIKKPLLLGAPVQFWLKRPTQEQCGSDKTRFSPLSTVIMCDAHRSEQSWAQAYAALTGGEIPQFQFSRISRSDGGEVAESTECAVSHDPSRPESVACYNLVDGTGGTVTVNTKSAPDWEQHLSVIVDFSIDALACVEQHIARCQLEGCYRENNRSLSRTLSSMGRSSVSMGSLVRQSTKRAIKTFKSRDMEVRVWSLRKSSPERPDTDYKQLDLVLVVPSQNVDEHYVKKRDRAAAVAAAKEQAEADQAAGVPSSATELMSLEEETEDGPRVWAHCYWELRATTAITTITITEQPAPDAVSPAASRRQSLVETDQQRQTPQEQSRGEEEAVLSVDAVTEKLVVVEAVGDGASLCREEQPEPVMPEPVKITSSHTETTYSLVGQWLAGESFQPDQWHSVGFTLQTTQDSEYGQCSPNQCDDAALQVESTAVCRDQSTTASAELVVDGQGKIRVTEGMTVGPPGTASGSRPATPASVPLKVSSVAAGEILASWLADYPFYEDLAAIEAQRLAALAAAEAAETAVREAKDKKGKKGKGAPEKLPEIEPVAEVQPPVDHNNKLLVSVGGQGFNGGLKGVALCGRADRCDVSRATACYDSYRRQQAEWLLESNNRDADTVAVPDGYTLADECTLDLFCGSAELPFDRIRIPLPPLTSTAPASTSTPDAPTVTATHVPEGLYVLEVSDAVDPDCVAADVCAHTATVLTDTRGEVPAESGGSSSSAGGVSGKNDTTSTAAAVPTARQPREVLGMARVARRLAANVEIVVKIDPPLGE